MNSITKYKGGFLLLLVCIYCNNLFSQPVFLNYNQYTQQIYEQDIYKNPQIHSSIKPFLASSLNTKKLIDSTLYINSNKKYYSYFFNKNYIEIASKKIIINPIIQTTLQTGNTIKTAFNAVQYGIQLQATTTKHIALNMAYAFCSTSETNTIKTPDSLTIVPHYGKAYLNNSNVNYFLYKGYIAYQQNQHYIFQAGYDKNFFGDGYRSLLLSDNANAYPFIKAMVNVYKINYVFLYSFLQDINSFKNTSILYKKYSVSHFLSCNIGKRINISLFETVIWKGGAGNTYRGFEVNYFNPVIFFRPVEFTIGSPDNVLLGANGRLRIGKNNHLYGQLILDEFYLDRIREHNGWWGNKFGMQAGFKMFNVATIKNLFFLCEANAVRPFTYSHVNTLQNYGNYYQPLAHPLGANFFELISNLQYRFARILFNAVITTSVCGKDTSAGSLGNNIYKPYTLRYTETGHDYLQGNKQQIIDALIKTAYIINPSMNLVFELCLRNHYIKFLNSSYNSMFITIGLKTYIYNTPF